jgi:hypothetical protein
MRCLICGTIMDSVNAGFGTHPNCDMKLLPVTEDEDPFITLLKDQIITMVKWAEQQNPRSKQVLMGPSEIGTDWPRYLHATRALTGGRPS